jgi:hypothetical protein
MLKRIDAFTRFIEDGRICLSNNAAEWALRGIAFGRKAWLFAGSDRGGERAALASSMAPAAPSYPSPEDIDAVNEATRACSGKVD